MHIGLQWEFFKRDKNRVYKKTLVCPDCKVQFRSYSLVSENMEIEDFAKWVFDYRSVGYWQKCNRTKLMERLYQYGWAKEFWDAYKKLKDQFLKDNPEYARHLTEKNALI